MSMAAFQRAYADLATSPKLCLAVRTDPVAALASYDLDARERGRLARAVCQRGMDANCTLYRATRITALNSVAPLTLRLIQPVMRAPCLTPIGKITRSTTSAFHARGGTIHRLAGDAAL
jgi:hypothetical protein